MGIQRVIHFKQCTVTSDEEYFEFTYLGTGYKLGFHSEHFDNKKGATLEYNNSGHIDTKLLLWLSVYFGEDFVDPRQKADSRFVDNRGDFELSTSDLARFLRTTENMPPKSYPKWKRQLLDNAITYYSAAIRSGLNLMPLTIGLFGMSLECIGNLYYGKRDKHFSLGNKKFRELLNTRQKRYKQSATYRQKAKELQKFVDQDIELIHAIRNAYYGHSLLHLQKDRENLVQNLRNWYLRYGHSKKFTNLSFRVSRVDNDVAREAHGLYKVGLRTARLFIFMLLGFSSSIPFASHDFRSIGDMQKLKSNNIQE